MAIKIQGLEFPFVARFKGPDTLDELIDALERNRADVWPAP
jgi:hypothetical protein